MYTTWIGEVGLGHWERSGLGGDGDGVEVIGGVSNKVHQDYMILLLARLFL